MQNLQAIELTVTQEGDTYKAKAAGWPAEGTGRSFKEAIGEWVYFNAMGTNLKIGGPVFQPEAAAARAALEALQ